MPTYTIEYLPAAAREVRKLDTTIRRRVLAAIEKLAHDPRPHGSEQLVGGEGERRIRVGDYRIVYEVEDDRLIVLVLATGHRRDVYRKRRR